MTQQQQFNLLCWEGYDDPVFTKKLRRDTAIDLSTENLVSDHAAAQQILHQLGEIDALNINNPYPKKVLYPANRIHRLEASRLPELLPVEEKWMQRFGEWGYADDDSCIGICQRFGSFNLVINNNKISHDTAMAVGFNLPDETSYQMPYGILQFPEFNLFHICIAAGLNPFATLNEKQLDTFSEKAAQWFQNADIVTADSNLLNRALVQGDIAFYLSGGVFVAGAARLEGHKQIECITPASGPIEGKGAISFVEVNALTTCCRDLDAGYRFLNQILQPDSAAWIAMNPKVCNPFLQMQQKDIFPRLSERYLEAIQWETLEEDISRCAMYDIPPQFDSLLQRLENVYQKRN